MISLDKAEARQLISIADMKLITTLGDTDRSVLAREDVDNPVEQTPLVLDGYPRPRLCPPTAGGHGSRRRGRGH